MPGLRTISGAPVTSLAGSAIRMLAADGVTWLTLTAVPKRTNLAPNPRAATVSTGFNYNAAGGTAGTSRGVEGTTTFGRCAWTAAGTQSGAGGIYAGQTGASTYEIDTSPGLAYSWSALVRCSKAQRVATRTYFYDSAGTQLLQVINPTPVVLTAGAWTYVKNENAVAPAGTVRMLALCYATTGTGWVQWAAGDTLDMTQVIVEQAATVGPFFDGATPGDVDYRYLWSSAANASTSLAMP